MFSIVYQGRYSSVFEENVLNGTKYSDDVILAVWEDSINEADALRLVQSGIKIVKVNDPGSVPSYVENGIQKTLNVKRVLFALENALPFARYDAIIKCRLDTTLDFDKFYSIWVDSNRKYASLNITSTCPTRLFSPPYLYCVSDWVLAFNKEDFIANCASVQVNESDYLCSSTFDIKGLVWGVNLGAEQIISLVFSGLHNQALDLKNKLKYENYTSDELKMHNIVLANYANINRDHVSFCCTKYKARSSRWTMFENIDFSDEGKFKLAPLQLFLHLISKCRLWVKT